VSFKLLGKQFHVVGLAKANAPPPVRGQVDTRIVQFALLSCSQMPATNGAGHGYTGRQSDVKYPGAKLHRHLNTHSEPNTVVDVQPVELVMPESTSPSILLLDSALDRISKCWRRFLPQHWGHAAACQWASLACQSKDCRSSRPGWRRMRGPE